jgi:hypothetical protein
MARLMFQVGSRTIMGSLGAKFLHCTMRPAQGGVLPPPGEYQIVAPVSDPIYGRLALMTPAGGSAPIPGKFTEKPLTGKSWEKPDSGKFSEKYDSIHSAGGGQVFVLSDRPVLGRNCIVVSSGFADLMDALLTSGGATARVV